MCIRDSFKLRVVRRVLREPPSAAGGDMPVPRFRLRVDEVFRGVPRLAPDRAFHDVVSETGEAVLRELQAAGVGIAEPPKAF